MAKKFDTNPLDPEFPKKIAEAETSALPTNAFKTVEFPTATQTEEQTKRFNEADFQAYQSPYLGENVPVAYQTTRLYPDNFESASNRKVAKIGLPENILVALPYLPFGIGWIAGLIELLVLPKSEPKVRFHAAQGFALHIGVFIIGAILGIADNVSNLVDFGNGIFQLVMFIMFIIWTIKAYKGKPLHIEAVDDLTNWLEEKISLNQTIK